MRLSRIAAVLQRLLPRRLFLVIYGTVASVMNAWALLATYGFARSAYSWRAVDRKGNPIPWFTYPAIEYLSQLDLSQAKVFEYGSGASTIYWAQRTARVDAVEDDVEWFHRIKPTLGSNATLQLASTQNEYVNDVARSGGTYDVIVVDGSHRYECATKAVEFLSSTGFIILDDADDHRAACESLRQSGLIEVDFSGFGPINGYTKTTSLFLRPNFRPQSVADLFPAHSLFRRR